MKKFEFSLEKMLHYKETIYDKEKNALGQLRAEQNALEQRMEDNDLQALETDAKMKMAAAQGTTVLQLQAFSFQIENARSLKKQYSKDLELLMARIEKQLHVVLELSKEISGLEKLREKQRAEYDYSVQRAEAEQISELVSSRYTREKAGAQK